MKPNLCLLDRIVRAVVGAPLVAGGLLLVRTPVELRAFGASARTGGLVAAKSATSALGLLVALLGALLVFSSSLGFCHVYKFFGLSTKRR